MKDDSLTTTSNAVGPQDASQSGTRGSTSIYKVGLEQQWQYSWQSVTLGTPQDVPIESGTDTGQHVGTVYPNRARRVIRKFRIANQDGEV